MSAYTDLITSEHAGAPRFVATVATSTDPLIDLQGTLAGMPGKFDLDQAKGVQLDIVGQWVGRNRDVVIPISGVYFAWDAPGVGWDQGYWQGPFDPTQGISELPDGPYLTLLRATIALNHWDGTTATAAAAITPVFPNNAVAILNNQDMTMTISVSGQVLDAVTISLLTGGYLSLVPSGIGVNYLFTSSPPLAVFAWDVDNTYFGGWDDGAWGVTTPPVY